MKVKMICTVPNCRDPFCDREHVGVDCCDHGTPFEEDCAECDQENAEMGKDYAQ